MINKSHILIVEDDASLAFVIKDNLVAAGYDVTHAHDGEEAIDLFDPKIHMLCLLDVMMPKSDGFSCAKELRKINSHTPLLFLTARSMQEDKIQGFLSGGDDYITKPFNFQELLHRVDVFIRRSTNATLLEAPKKISESIIFDFANLTLTVNEEVRKLTSKEGEIINFFLENANQLVKREEILKKIWGDDDYFIGRSLDVFISRLRKYLSVCDKVDIINHHGVGFSLRIRT